jgi:hypothetical protein
MHFRKALSNLGQTFYGDINEVCICAKNGGA